MKGFIDVIETISGRESQAVSMVGYLRKHLEFSLRRIENFIREVRELKEENRRLWSEVRRLRSKVVEQTVIHKYREELCAELLTD